MTPQSFYQLIYSILSSHTPIKGDCGQICGKACCAGDKNGDGMYLFPGEEFMYKCLPSWASISETDFEYAKGKFAPLFSCDGVCQRDMRPLACRIFPLTPYITADGKLQVIVDPRSKGMCPLSPLKTEDFDPQFVKAVERAGKVLAKNSLCKEFLVSFSRMLDETDFLF